MGTSIVTRDELELYDLFKATSYIMFLMSILVLGMGKCGLRIVRMEKSKVGKRVLRKSTVILAFIGLFGAILMHQGKEIHQIVKQYKK